MSHRAIRWDLIDSDMKTKKYKGEIYGKVMRELMSPCPVDKTGMIEYLYIAAQYEEQIEAAWEKIKKNFEWNNN